MSLLPDWAAAWVSSTGGALTDREREFLGEFEKQAPASSVWNSTYGRLLDGISLGGPADDPTLVVFFRDERQRPGSRYAYHHRLRTEGSPPYLILNHIDEAMSSSPGLPRWEPSADGVIHVDLQDDRYWHRGHETE